jgi:mono/diheme cytochrome c family protein
MFRHPAPSRAGAMHAAASLLLCAGLGACNSQAAGDGHAPEARAATPTAATNATAAAPADDIARGAYVAMTSGCNDCHTPGYAESGGQVPRERWLTGSPLGWQGPWGTTYPANLRLKLQSMDEQAWMDYSASLHTRPPMPDFAIRAMSEADRRALYRFVRSLGPAGQPAPAYLPPGTEAPLPYVKWMLPPPPQAPAAG